MIHQTANLYYEYVFATFQTFYGVDLDIYFVTTTFSTR